MSEKIQLKGIPAAPGIAIGPAYKLGKEEFNIIPQDIKEDQIPLQIQLFEEAIIKTRKEILNLQKKISEEMGHDTAEIFDAHLLVLEDRMLIEEVINTLKKERLNVAYVFSKVLKKYVNVFSKIEDEYLRERIIDVNDIGKRILRNLLGKTHSKLDGVKEPVIVVSADLSPSDTASMHKNDVRGFVTDIGSKTSHTAIMAKSLEIPAVVGTEEATDKIKAGDILIVDGTNGVVIINPDEKTLEFYRKEAVKYKDIGKRLVGLRKIVAQTVDGRKIEVAANLELPSEIPAIKQYGAEGIGLYRTEFFYMNRKDLPTEDEHFEAYKHVANLMKPDPVTIRTLDLGGDKFISQLQVPHEMFPFLGWRAIRFCLARPDIFKIQLRAILRASVFGKLRIMYPMISGIEEIRQANSLLEEAKKELKAEKFLFDENIEVGTMIEVPSAALTADLLARESDFFSIGTNDLIQYALAIDRANEKVAYLYEPAHPAVLRMIKTVIDAAHNSGIWVGMCGEMAGDPAFVPMLIGLGLDEFSMSPFSIPEVKQVICALTMDTARKIADEGLKLSTGKEVEEFNHRKLRDILKGK